MDQFVKKQIETPAVSEHHPGAGLALHRHQSGYVAVVLEGGYAELSADGRWFCEAGDIIVHPPFHLHTNRFEKKRTRVLNLSGRVAEQVIKLGGGYGVYRSPLADDILRAPDDPGVLISVVKAAAPVQPTRASEWLQRLAAQLSGNHPVSIGSAARRSKVTPEHASRTFCMSFGMPPSRFRAELRLQRALGLLGDRTLSIANVAQLAGFYDQAHLARALRAEIGMTARQIRACYA